MRSVSFGKGTSCGVEARTRQESQNDQKWKSACPLVVNPCLCSNLQQIDGEAFLLLKQNDIVKILSIKLGPALKIYNAILMFKSAEDN